MKLLRAFRRIFVNSDRSAQMLAEIREGVANLAGEVNRQEAESRAASADSAGRSEQLLLEIRDGIANLTDVIDRRLAELPQTADRDAPADNAPRSEESRSRVVPGSGAFYRGEG